MDRDILIDVGSDRIRLAVLENNQVVELRVESPDKSSLVGNIYRGKVERVVPGMQSAFVDIGFEKNAYLPDVPQNLSQGQEITIQIIKDGIDEKGPRATTNLSLSGRYSVYMPLESFISISKKINSLDERIRLKKIAAIAKDEEGGIIVRTAAEGISQESLLEDINELQELWGKIKLQQKRGKVPRTLYEEDGIMEIAVREYITSNTNRIIINDKEAYEELFSRLRNNAEQSARVQYFHHDYDMFEFYGVEGAIKEALSRKVWLKSGAYLVFDYTEALTVIDVNSGKNLGKKELEETALKINLEAAQTIAQQIRLRNLSGIIIVDFIDMHKEEHKEELLQLLRDLVKADKTYTVIVGMTRLGLVEMTRKKVRLPLAKQVTTPHTH